MNFYFLAAIAAAFVSSATAPPAIGDAVGEASKAWADCISHESKLGSRGVEPPSKVVDHAYQNCVLAEQQFVQKVVASRHAASSGGGSENEIALIVAAQVAQLKREHQASFERSVQQLRAERAAATGVTSPYGDPELDAVMARSASRVRDAQLEKIKIYKQSCADENSYLSLLSFVSARDRPVLIETCAIYRRQKSSPRKK